MKPPSGRVAIGGWINPNCFEPLRLTFAFLGAASVSEPTFEPPVHLDRRTSDSRGQDFALQGYLLRSCLPAFLIDPDESVIQIELRQQASRKPPETRLWYQASTMLPLPLARGSRRGTAGGRE